MTIHNFSSMTLTIEELQLLNKGLTFIPTTTLSPIKAQLKIMEDFDKFAKTLRQKFVHTLYYPLKNKKSIIKRTDTSNIYRRMKFLPKQTTTTITQQFSGVSKVEHYIEQTKNNLNDRLQTLIQQHSTNFTMTDKKVIKKLKQVRHEITIKPADKNLGIVLLDTDDYITECTRHLADTNTYRLTNNYPKEDIQKNIHNTIISFKSQIHDHNKRLYDFLLSEPDNSRIPQFYGIPKVHKKFTRIPPVRPIISQCSSPLNHTARFIDHILQPLAQSYPDYIQNSTTLCRILQNLYVPDEALLVTMDVNSLYPSIPQSDMLQIIYEEIHSHRHLVPFDPNLLIRILHLNVNHTYFEFASQMFQQIKGTAMGAPFSPTVANIYMSVILRKFLHTQINKPLLIVRYIDDIFIIWTYSTDDLHTFIEDLNSSNSSISYTSEHSNKHQFFGPYYFQK